MVCKSPLRLTDFWSFLGFRSFSGTVSTRLRQNEYFHPPHVRVIFVTGCRYGWVFLQDTARARNLGAHLPPRTLRTFERKCWSGKPYSSAGKPYASASVINAVKENHETTSNFLRNYRRLKKSPTANARHVCFWPGVFPHVKLKKFASHKTRRHTSSKNELRIYLQDIIFAQSRSFWSTRACVASISTNPT